MTDWDAQKAVWDGLFSFQALDIDTKRTSVLITEPPFNLPNVQDVYDQFVFEEYEFQSYYRCTPASLIPYGGLFSKPGLPTPECVVIVDSGFSFTHVIPIRGSKVVWEAVVRIDVGGKLMTNHLKELVSFRQWNMLDETWVINNIKEQCCFVTTNLHADLEACRTDPKRNRVVKEYVLPNFASRRVGHVRSTGEELLATDQVLYMGNERFLVPEILFHPDDIGLDQTGLAGAIDCAISRLPEDTRGMYWANIGLIGGNTKLPGFQDRLFTELRKLAPIDYDICIFQATDPITEAYRSAVNFTASPHFSGAVVSREEYMEAGSNVCRRKFGGWNAGEGLKQKIREGGGKTRVRQAEEGLSTARKGFRKKQ